MEFVSSEEAKNAFKHLKNSHLYGRKLIIEWSKPESDVFTNNEGQPSANAENKALSKR